MNLRVFTRLVICCLAFLIFNTSCNSDSNYEIGELSPDGQISSFSIAATPSNAADSARFPAMAKTAFTIINKNSYLIYNVDSLPQGINFDSLKLKLTMSYSSTPARIDLVYKDKQGNDSIPEETWNTTDSVQFIQKGNDGYFLPELKVIAPDGTERRYSIIYNVHTSDPDSIRWMRVMDANKKPINLPKVGENKTIANTDKTTFYSLTNDGSKVYLYSSKIEGETVVWENIKATNLLSNSVVVKSFQLVDGYFVIGAQDGKVYTVKEDGDWTQWTAHSANHVSALIGSLPSLDDQTSSNLLFIIKKSKDVSVFAKAKIADIDNPTELGFLSPTVPSDFPIADFSTVSGDGIGLGKEYLVVTGGKNTEKELINRSWVIRELTGNKIEAVKGYKDDLAEYKHGVTTFAYAKEMYMISNDSIYTSKGYGSHWAKADKKKVFQKDIIENGMDMPSVVVDKDNFVWIFGGKLKGDNVSYSDKIWRGRLNKLTHKRIN